MKSVRMPDKGYRNNKTNETFRFRPDSRTIVPAHLIALIVQKRRFEICRAVFVIVIGQPAMIFTKLIDSARNLS